MKKQLYYLIATATALYYASCSQSGGQNPYFVHDSIPEIKKDSIFDFKTSTEIKELPDTQFTSIDIFDYKTEIIDTTIDSKINSLKNCYENIDGILTFRGDPWRRANYNGYVEGKPDTVLIDWTFKTDIDNTPTKYGTWGGGTGWTGQPLYINWPDSMVTKFKNSKAQLTEDFSNKEIILGSLSSNVYFINYETGKKSRESVYVNNPIKGTLMIDPAMNGKVYVGQGVPAREPFGQITIDLFQHNTSNTQMRDSKAWRGWGASDSSPIRVGQFVFRPSENGTIYKYYVENGEEKLQSTLKYKRKGAGGPGMESSMAVYANYGYIGDNHGNVMCINLNTMKPVWRFDNKDDTDGTPVIVEEEGHPYIYSGCEMDRQGATGQSHFSKIDGLTGEKIWSYDQDAKKVNIGTKHFDGGYYSTPLVGSGNCSDLIFVNYVANENGQNGYFYAFETQTGKLRYQTSLKYYSWSSPVGLLNENNEQFIVTGDTAGRIYIIEGSTGEILYVKSVGSNFESTPIIVEGNHVVLGSRGSSIYKMTVKQK